MIVWLDLETTGLDTKNDVILEVGAIVTDDQFEEVARFHVVTHGARVKTYSQLNQAVRDMHFHNGLWMESLRSETPLGGGHAVPHLDALLEEFVKTHAVKTAEDGKVYKPVLAGSSVHFDRAVLDTWCPHTVSHLHYRILDVSSLNELVLRTWPDVWKNRPQGSSDKSQHRAIPDIELSLAVARYYRKALGQLPDGVKAA